MGALITTPNTSRFKRHFHSRILHKFPFLMEMFYWVLTYASYQISRFAAQALASKDIWELAKANGLKVLWVEQFSFLRFLFPVEELEVQRWFMNDHETLLTVLNRVYALIHIPGSIFFLGWYYYSSPSHGQFAVVRRTVTLMNWLAFTVFTFYPCMPPRLLPEEYGFVDTVRRGSAGSVFMKGKYVNSLAAMPSMHFGYSFIVGVTLLYHSGVFSRKRRGAENGRFWNAVYVLLGVTYPLLILITIVATANHVSLFVLYISIPGMERKRFADFAFHAVLARPHRRNPRRYRRLIWQPPPQRLPPLGRLFAVGTPVGEAITELRTPRPSIKKITLNETIKITTSSLFSTS